MNVIVGCLIALAILLLWWPVSTHQIPTKTPSSKNYYHVLLALVSEIETAPNFDEAFASVVGINFDRWSQDNPEHSLMLTRVRKLAQDGGISSKSLINYLLTHLNHAKTAANTWKEKSAAARTASMMLFVLPAGLWLMASAMGVDALGWIFGTSWGRLCLIIGLFLNVVSRVLLRLLHKKFTQQSSASVPKKSSLKIPQLEPNAVAIFVSVVCVFAIPNIFGLAIAVVSFIAAREGWPKLLSSQHLASHKNMVEQRPWVATVIAGSLKSGASWLDGVQNAATSSDGFMHNELMQVTQRLRWGVEPEVAFDAAHKVLRPISETIQRSAQTGAPIHSTLLKQAALWQEESQTQVIQKTEVAGERLIVPVTLLQLPAFFLLGIVPMVVAEIAPMLETFSSTATQLS